MTWKAPNQATECFAQRSHPLALNTLADWTRGGCIKVRGANIITTDKEDTYEGQHPGVAGTDQSPPCC